MYLLWTDKCELLIVIKKQRIKQKSKNCLARKPELALIALTGGSGSRFPSRPVGLPSTASVVFVMKCLKGFCLYSLEKYFFFWFVSKQTKSLGTLHFPWVVWVGPSTPFYLQTLGNSHPGAGDQLPALVRMLLLFVCILGSLYIAQISQHTAVTSSWWWFRFPDCAGCSSIVLVTVSQIRLVERIAQYAHSLNPYPCAWPVSPSGSFCLLLL